MPIEFRCTQCERLLRTPDGSAGQRAVCPECGAAVPIPELLDTGAGGPRWDSAAGPFAHSGISGWSAGTSSAGGSSQWQGGASFRLPDAAFRPVLDLGAILSRTWNDFARQWLMAVLAPLAAFGVWVLGVAGAAGGVGVAALVDHHADVVIPAAALAVVACLALTAWLHAGLTLVFLKIAHGAPAEIGDVFSGGPYFLRIIVAQVLIGLTVIFGLCLFVLPAVIFWLMFSQSTFLIVDRNAGVLESLRLSCRATWGNRLLLLAILLIAWVAGGAISSSTVLLATLVVAPFLRLMRAVIYLSLTGQSPPPPAGAGEHSAS